MLRRLNRRRPMIISVPSLNHFDLAVVEMVQAQIMNLRGLTHTPSRALEKCSLERPQNCFARGPG